MCVCEQEKIRGSCAALIPADLISSGFDGRNRLLSHKSQILQCLWSLRSAKHYVKADDLNLTLEVELGVWSNWEVPYKTSVSFCTPRLPEMLLQAYFELLNHLDQFQHILRNVHIRACYWSLINNPIFTFPVFCVLAVRTFMNHWLLIGHWLFQSQQEGGEGAAGSPWGTQTHGRSIIHGSLWACSEHWHPTCLNQTGPVSLMPLGRSMVQVKVGVGGWRGLSSGWGAGDDCNGQTKKSWKGRLDCGVCSFFRSVCLFHCSLFLLRGLRNWRYVAVSWCWNVGKNVSDQHGDSGALASPQCLP